MKRTPLLATLALAATFALAGCGDDDPLTDDPGDGGGEGGPVVVGSANFPESIVLAEVYAEALRQHGVEVETKLNIGSREAYIPAIAESGEVDVFPEYTGNLRLYFNEDATASDPDGVYAELEEALPDTLVCSTWPRPRTRTR